MIVLTDVIHKLQGRIKIKQAGVLNLPSFLPVMLLLKNSWTYSQVHTGTQANQATVLTFTIRSTLENKNMYEVLTAENEQAFKMNL